MFNPFNLARPESTLSNNGIYEATDEELQEYRQWKYENECVYFPEGRDEIEFDEVDDYFDEYYSDDENLDENLDGFQAHQWNDGDYWDED
jgi:hypothetical protein